MPTIEVSRFHGINRQPSGKYRPGDLYEALNVELTALGALVRRGSMDKLVSPPAASGGLYSVGQSLHTAAPSGTSIAGLAPTIHVDLLTLNSGTAVEAVHGAVTNANGKAFLLVETDTGALEFHQSEGADVTPGGSTYVTPIFTPIASRIVKLNGRAYALDAGAGPRLLRFSAIDDPAGGSNITEWDPNADPDDSSKRGGFINIGQHEGGGGEAVTIAEFQGRLAVFFPGQVQIWRVGSDPETDALLEDVIEGAGAQGGQAAHPVGSDVVFFDPSLTVRSLVSTDLTESAADLPVGRSIEPLIDDVWSAALTPRTIYNRTRAQWMLALGTDVFCLRIGPGERPVGWTRWELPFAVDDWAMSGRDLAIRSGDSLYKVNYSQSQGDEEPLDTYTGFPLRVETQRLVGGPEMKQITAVASQNTEQVRMQVVRDGRPALNGDGSLPGSVGSIVTMPARSPEPSVAKCAWTARTVAFRIHDDSAAASWRLEGLYLTLRSIGRTGVT